MLSFRNRFHGHNSLRYVYKNGEVIRSRFITLKYTHNPRRKNQRVAVVISKKVLKRAVGRNRVRRRVYEIVRCELPRLAQNQDIVLLVFSAEVKAMPQEELKATIVQLLTSAKLYKKEQ